MVQPYMGVSRTLSETLDAAPARNGRPVHRQGHPNAAVTGYRQTMLTAFQQMSPWQPCASSRSSCRSTASPSIQPKPLSSSRLGRYRPASIRISMLIAQTTITNQDIHRRKCRKWCPSNWCWFLGGGWDRTLLRLLKVPRSPERPTRESSINGSAFLRTTGDPSHHHLNRIVQRKSPSFSCLLRLALPADHNAPRHRRPRCSRTSALASRCSHLLCQAAARWLGNPGDLLSNLPSAWLRLVLALAFMAFSISALWRRARPRMLVASSLLGVIVWSLTIQPSHHRPWRPEVAALPHMSVHSDRVQITASTALNHTRQFHDTMKSATRSRLSRQSIFSSAYWARTMGHTFSF